MGRKESDRSERLSTMMKRRWGHGHAQRDSHGKMGEMAEDRGLGEAGPARPGTSAPIPGLETVNPLVKPLVWCGVMAGLEDGPTSSRTLSVGPAQGRPSRTVPSQAPPSQCSDLCRV